MRYRTRTFQNLLPCWGIVAPLNLVLICHSLTNNRTPKPLAQVLAIATALGSNLASAQKQSKSLRHYELDESRKYDIQDLKRFIHERSLNLEARLI